MSSSSHLVIRCDASPEMGTGHLMRCLTLADVWHQDFSGAVIFCCLELTGTLERRIVDAGHAVIHLENDHPGAVIDIAEPLDAKAIILDGYQFDQEYRQSLASSDTKVLTFRDAGSEASSADIVIDTSPSATAPVQTDIVYLCGPDFALISPEIVKSTQISVSPKGILITFGGSDPHGLSLPIAKSISASAPDTHMHVILGGGVKDADAVLEQLMEIPNISASHDLPSLGPAIMNAQLVVTAAGSSLYEVASLGRPMVLVITEDNQSALGTIDWAHVIDVRGKDAAAADISAAALKLYNDPAMMEALAARASSVVDGKGAHRVLETLTTQNGF